LPLTTARQRLGTLVFACKQPSAYETADVSFLQLVANQVAVSVENALAFQEIEALTDQLSKANAYREEEVRTEHNFGELIGESAALRQVLKEAETVAPAGSTVLIRGESGTGKELRRDVAYLVEEECSLVRQLEAPDPSRPNRLPQKLCWTARERSGTLGMV
jgi:formate hydrogenlyase transcriptional activator